MATSPGKRVGGHAAGPTGALTATVEPAPAITKGGKKRNTSGGAARNARGASVGGMDAIVEAVLRSFLSGPRERIEEIRQGVPARRISELSSAMDVPKEHLVDFLGLSRATVNRKVQRGQPLSREESERVVGMQALIGQVQAMVAEGGVATAGFDAARWLAQWLAQPLPALGGDTPASYLDTVEGQKLVSRLLAMAESGAYA